MKINDLFEDDPRVKSERVRLTISIPVSALAVYKRMADVSGLSISRSIGDWLSDTSEGAQAMAELLEMARSQPLRAASEVHAAAVKANSLTFELMQKLSGVEGDGSAEARSRGAGDPAPSGGASDGGTPPVSNTGGKGSQSRRKGQK